MENVRQIDSNEYWSRTKRCGQRRQFEKVPGNFTFRQEWPLQPCSVKPCQARTTREEIRVDHPGGRFCKDYNEHNPSKVEEAGPLDLFDQRVKDILEMDAWGEKPRKHGVPGPLQPPLLSRNTNAILGARDDVFGDDQEYKAFAKKLALIEKYFNFEQALLMAERAAASASSPEQAEQAALDSARGYSITLDPSSGSKTRHQDGEKIIEVTSYVGVTKPTRDHPSPYDS